MTQKPTIVWFKRDLRVHDHRPLFEASQNGAPIIPLYIVEPEYWQQPFASSRHWHFIHDCLAELNNSLTALGQPLVVRVGDACNTIKELANAHGVGTLWAHEETADLWTYERDLAVHKMCQHEGLEFNELPSNGVVRRLKSRDDWSRIRNRRMAESITPKPAALVPVSGCRSDPMPTKDHEMFGQQLPQTQRGGRVAAVADLRSFLEERCNGYLKNISSPLQSERHCSRLSAHLAWGSLSVREVQQALKRRKAQINPQEKKAYSRNLSAFGARLAWRCHFIQKLEDQPAIETHCMHPAFEGMRENDHNDAYFDAWAKGQTGFPFVDACMRSLIETGWVTFRMRAMLVSFASYQLWLDWRKTAPYLARLFTDYEPGIHYSQFQMQSGVTGINAIRIYNPIKQSQEQDPEGVFIRKWVPELRHITDTNIHEPWKATTDLFNHSDGSNRVTYPAPIVSHSDATSRAKKQIAAVRKTPEFRATSKTVFQKLGSRKKTRSRPTKPNRVQRDLFSTR